MNKFSNLIFQVYYLEPNSDSHTGRKDEENKNKIVFHTKNLNNKVILFMVIDHLKSVRIKKITKH